MERPTKKPRLQGPDGFAKSKTMRYRLPESVTNFVSAFEGASSSPVKHADNALHKDPPKKSHVQARPRNPFVDFDLSKGSEPGPSKLSVKVAHPPHVANLKVDRPLLALKPLKPPVFLPVATSLQTTKPTRPSLAPPPKLPPAPIEKPRSILKPPPVIPLPSTKRSAPLKPLAPPPLPECLVPSPQKHANMKTIRTTRVAQATDPSREGAGAELLSLFLQQHGHRFTSAMDRELQRGVVVSPDKRSRGKDAKFVRGGLAEHVQHRLSCAKTDFVLWKRQMEQKLEAGSKVASDMQLRVLRVLDVSKALDRPRFPTGPRAGLALCRLTRRPQHHQLAGLGQDLALGTYVVLFHFAPAHGGRSAVSDAERFEDTEGNDVLVWAPWHKVEVAGTESGSAGLLEMFRALDALTPPRSLLVVSRFCVVAPKLVQIDGNT